jgi:hypothetical protein
MRKYSRRNGWMRLATCASGDGSVSFSWVADRNSGMPEQQVLEPVTESDVSEYLRDSLVSARWGGWDIVMLSGKPRLARLVKRPHHSSRKLVLDRLEYEYSTVVRRARGRIVGIQHSSANTEFKTGGQAVADTEAILSLVFFLNHEEDFRASGHETRER